MTDPRDTTSNRYAEERGREYVRLMRATANHTAATLRFRAELDPRLDIRRALHLTGPDPLEDAFDACVNSFDRMTEEQLHRLLNGIHDEVQEQFNQLVVDPALSETRTASSGRPTEAAPTTADLQSDPVEATLSSRYQLGVSFARSVVMAASYLNAGTPIDLSLPDVHQALRQIQALTSPEELRYVIAGANMQVEHCISQARHATLPPLRAPVESPSTNITLAAVGRAYIADIYSAMRIASQDDEVLNDRLSEERDQLLGPLGDLEAPALHEFLDGTIEAIGQILNFLLNNPAGDDRHMRRHR
jgi:hypothetical protein